MNVDLLETYKIGNYEKAAVFIGYEHLHRLITKQEKCAGTPIDDFNTPPALQLLLYLTHPLPPLQRGVLDTFF